MSCRRHPPHSTLLETGQDDFRRHYREAGARLIRKVYGRAAWKISRTAIEDLLEREFGGVRFTVVAQAAQGSRIKLAGASPAPR